jgi:hypothetical protein
MKQKPEEGVIMGNAGDRQHTSVLTVSAWGISVNVEPSHLMGNTHTPSPHGLSTFQHLLSPVM